MPISILLKKSSRKQIIYSSKNLLNTYKLENRNIVLLHRYLPWILNRYCHNVITKYVSYHMNTYRLNVIKDVIV